MNFVLQSSVSFLTVEPVVRGVEPCMPPASVSGPLRPLSCTYDCGTFMLTCSFLLFDCGSYMVRVGGLVELIVLLPMSVVCGAGCHNFSHDRPSWLLLWTVVPQPSQMSSSGCAKNKQ